MLGVMGKGLALPIPVHVHLQQVGACWLSTRRCLLTPRPSPDIQPLGGPFLG